MHRFQSQGCTIRRAFFWATALLCHAIAQKGIGSLNDPCDCMQHHDYWMAARTTLTGIYNQPSFAQRIFNPYDRLHEWVQIQSCMYSPENEEAHRLTALSDCIPGFLMAHLACMQGHIINGNIGKVWDYVSELSRLFPWGVKCMDNGAWPFTAEDIIGYIRRVKRVVAAMRAEGFNFEDEAEAIPTHWKELLVWDVMSVRTHEGDAERHIYEFPDVCPAFTYPARGVCWILGRVGESCSQACMTSRMAFRLPRGKAVEQPMLPYLMAAAGRNVRVKKQHEWGPFECFVEAEERFHFAHLEARIEDRDWSYPICSLVCPCVPEAPEEFRRALSSVPMFGEEQNPGD